MGNAVSMRDRALTVLNGGMPVRFPFITRLEAWYKVILAQVPCRRTCEVLRWTKSIIHWELAGCNSVPHSDFGCAVWRLTRLSTASRYTMNMSPS